MDHLGVEVDTTGEVTAATGRLSEQGLFTRIENDTTCCYALQDKVWVHGPGKEPWEVYTVKADAPGATGIHPIGIGPISSGECNCGSTMQAADGGAPPADACCTPLATPSQASGPVLKNTSNVGRMSDVADRALR
jgi:hypothetical protein